MHSGIEAVSSIKSWMEFQQSKSGLKKLYQTDKIRSWAYDPEMDFGFNDYTLSSAETDNYSYLELQSGEGAMGSDASDGTQVLMQYVDETPGTDVDFNPIRDNTFYEGFSADASISKFLERPVLISSYTWEENTDLAYTVFPWFSYFNDPAIKRKIDNYALLSCNLRIKIMINASPFYYGLAYASYLPLPIFVDQRTIIDVGGSRASQVPFSQRQHVCL